MLRQPVRRSRQGRQKATIAPLPAPWKGLNTRDRLEETDPGYASLLENLIPGYSEVNLRRGLVEHATGLPDAPVESLMESTVGTGRRLFGAVGTEIYDVTTPGTVGAAALTGLTHADWQHTMFASAAGQFLIIANGSDGVKGFNGENWTDQAITNVNSATLTSPVSHKARLWFIQSNTMNAWYLPPLSVAGAASRLNLGPLARYGGTLQAASGWSVDAGDGADDYLVFVTSEGECIVFAGTDPNSENSWSHVGTYRTDRPMGRRCLVKFGADLLILTSSGVVSVSALLNAQSRWATISDVVRDGFQEMALVNTNAPGWQIAHYAKRGWLIANIPTSGGKFKQFLYNSLLPPGQGWCCLVGQDARCWGFLDGDPYFGGNGKVYRADTGQNDAGEPITARAQWAWNRFGTPSKKRFTLARLHMRSDSRPAPQVEIRSDYDVSPPNSVPTLTASTDGTLWDISDWDLAEWTADTDVYSQWIAISGIGHVGGLRMTYSSAGADFAIVGAEVAFEPGGVL